ncbi:unnamed protein product, partial [marine sediment metagenome]
DIRSKLEAPGAIVDIDRSIPPVAVALDGELTIR